MNFNPSWGGNRGGNRGVNHGLRRRGRGWRGNPGGPHRGGPPLFRGVPPGLRGRDGHHGNFRGGGYRGPPMDNYKQYPLPMNPGEHSWSHMRGRPLLPAPPSGPIQRRPFLSPPRCSVSPVRPSSPLPGTEEYMQRDISEKSAFLKRELALEGAADFVIDSTKHENFANDFVTDSTSSNFCDHPFEQQRIASLTEAEAQVEEENKSLQQAENVPSPRRSKKPTPRPTQQRVLNVDEIHDRIMNHISSLSLGKKMNLVNQARSTGYDIAFQQITRQKRLQLSKALRDMCNDKFKESNNSSDVINSIIPDFDIKIEELPRELVAQLSTTLNEDVEQRVQNTCIDPEVMFQQAADMLSFSLDGDPFGDAKESADGLHDAFNFSTFQNAGECSATIPDNNISQNVMEPIKNLTPTSCSNTSIEETRNIALLECQLSALAFNPLAPTNFAIPPIFPTASALSTESQNTDDQLLLQPVEAPEVHKPNTFSPDNSIFTPSDGIKSETCTKPDLQYCLSNPNSFPTNAVLQKSTVSQNASNDDNLKLPVASGQELQQSCDLKMKVDHILLPPGEPPPFSLTSGPLPENLAIQTDRPNLNMDSTVQEAMPSQINEEMAVTSDLCLGTGESLVQKSDVLAEAAELEACLAQSNQQLKLLEMSRPASVDETSKSKLIEMVDKKNTAEITVKPLDSTNTLKLSSPDDKQQKCVERIPIEEPPMEKIGNRPNESEVQAVPKSIEVKSLVSSIDQSAAKFSEAIEQDKASTDTTEQLQGTITAPADIKTCTEKSTIGTELDKTNKNQGKKTEPGSKNEEIATVSHAKNENKKFEQKPKPLIENEAVENKKGKKSSAKYIDEEDRCSKSRAERSRYDVFQAQKCEEEYRRKNKDRADSDEERYRRFERDRSFDKMHETYRSPDSEKSDKHRYSKYHSEREELRYSERYYHEKPYVRRPEYVDFKKDYSHHPQKHTYSPDYHSRQESPYLPEEYEQKSSHHSQHHRSKHGKVHKKRSKKHKRHRGSSAASSDVETSVSCHRKSKHRTKYPDLPDSPEERTPIKNHKKPLKERIQMLHESKALSRKRSSSGSDYDENLSIKSEPASPELSQAPPPERSKSVDRLIVEKTNELEMEDGGAATPNLPTSTSNTSRIDSSSTTCPNKTLTEDVAREKEMTDKILTGNKPDLSNKNLQVQEGADLVERPSAKALPTIDNIAPVIVQPKDKTDVIKVVQQPVTDGRLTGTLPHEICHPMRSWKSPGEKKFMMEHLSMNSTHEEEAVDHETSSHESVKKTGLNSLVSTNCLSGTKEEIPDTLDMDLLKEINVRKSFLETNSDLISANVKSIECKSPAKAAEININYCVDLELKTNQETQHGNIYNSPILDVRSKEIHSTSERLPEATTLNFVDETSVSTECIEPPVLVEQQLLKVPQELEVESNQGKSRSNTSASEGEVSSTSDTTKSVLKQCKSRPSAVSLPSVEDISLKKEDVIKEDVELSKPDDVATGGEKMLVTTYTQTQEEDAEPANSSHKKDKKEAKRDKKTKSNTHTQTLVTVASNSTQTQGVKCKNAQVQSDFNESRAAHKKNVYAQTEAVVIIDNSDSMSILDKSENCNKADRKALKAICRKRTIQRMFDLDKEIERLTKFRQKLYKQLNFDSDSDDNDLESQLNKKDVNSLVVDKHDKHKEKHSDSAKSKTSAISTKNEIKSNIDSNQNVHNSHHKRKKLKSTKSSKKGESKTIAEETTKKSNRDKVKTNRHSPTVSQHLTTDETPSHLNRISDVEVDKHKATSNTTNSEHRKSDKPPNSREASTEPIEHRTKKNQQLEPNESEETKHSKSKKKSSKRDHTIIKTKRSLQPDCDDAPTKSTENGSPPTKVLRKKSESKEESKIVKTANKAIKTEISAITPNKANTEAATTSKPLKKEKTPVSDRETKRRGRPKSTQKRKGGSKELEDTTDTDKNMKTDLGNESISVEQDKPKCQEANPEVAEDIDATNNEVIEEAQLQTQRKQKKTEIIDLDSVDDQVLPNQNKRKSRNISESHETDHGSPKKKPKRYPFSGIKSNYKSKRRKSSSSETNHRRKLSTDVEEKATPAFVGSVVNIIRYSLVQLEEMRKSIKMKNSDVPTHAASEKLSLAEDMAAEASNVAKINSSQRNNSASDIPKSPLPLVLVEDSESQAMNEEIPIKKDISHKDIDFTTESSPSANILCNEAESVKEDVNKEESMQKCEPSEKESSQACENEEIESNHGECIQECGKNDQPAEAQSGCSDDVEVINESIPDEYKMDFKGFSGAIIVIKVIASTALAASDKGKLLCFDMSNGDLTHTLDMSKLPITSMVVTQRNGTNIVYTGSLDSAIGMLNFDTKEVVKHIKVAEPVQCMESGWNYIFIGSDRGSLIRYDLNAEKFAEIIKISDFNVLVIKATQEGPRKVLIIATRNAPVSIRDACSGLLLRTMETPFSPTVYTLLFDRNLIYCGTSQHDILVYTFEDGQLIFKHEATKSKGVVCMQIVGNLLFAGCYNGNIYVYNAKTNVHLGTMNGPGGLMLSMEIVGNKIVVGTKSSNFRAWKIPQEYLDQI